MVCELTAKNTKVFAKGTKSELALKDFLQISNLVS